MFDATMNLTSFAVCTHSSSQSHIYRILINYISSRISLTTSRSDSHHKQFQMHFRPQKKSKNCFIFIHSASNQFFLDSHSFRHLTTFSDFYLFRHLTNFQIFTYSAILPYFRFSPITPSNHFLYFQADFYSFLHFLLISSHLLDFSKSVKIVMTCEK